MISATLVNTDKQTAIDSYTTSSANRDTVDRMWCLFVVVASVICAFYPPYENELIFLLSEIILCSSFVVKLQS